MEHLSFIGKPEPSRAGDVIVSPHPVMTVFTQPRERVLLNASRDANPYFHFFESIWMLSGARDASYLNTYVSDFTKRFADPGTTILHGAYGHRWQHIFYMDQLKVIIKILSEDPTSRRAVLTMWDPQSDLGGHHPDHPCNTNIFFRVNNGLLDMMVNCRSNDIVWGLYGANAVHMSMMQEYLAAAIDMEVGRYYQNSWNFHAYRNIFEKLLPGVNDTTWCAPYEGRIYPLVDNSKEFIRDCEIWVSDNAYDVCMNSIFMNVAVPMQLSFDSYKRRDFKHALKYASEIQSDDWRMACTEWLGRRIEKHERSHDRREEPVSRAAESGEG
jgi:hypothetical protein